MTDHITPPLTFVAGGTGKTGRRVIARLAAAGQPVRIGSRSAAVPFDWDDPATWPAALAGTRRAYIAYTPDLAFPGATERIADLTALAGRSGVERVVLLSGRGEPLAEAAEQIVLASGLEAIVLRCSFFAQNFSEHFLLDAVREGVIALPAGEVAEPVVDVDDIAEVAAAALTQSGHAGLVHELTGPRLLTFRQIAGELSAATGRHIAYVPVTPGDYAAAAITAGVPAEEAEGLAELFAHIFDGHNANVTSGVADALGRPARDFAAYASTTAATGVWDLAAAGLERP